MNKKSSTNNYFSSNNEEILNSEIKAVEDSKKYFLWVQEFSKKIVVIMFIFYLFSSLTSLILIIWGFKIGEPYSVDVLIEQINETFRDVIGGYIIKAAAENSFKIAGSYFVAISNARLNNIMKELDLKKEYNKENEESLDYEKSNIEDISELEDEYEN